LLCAAFATKSFKVSALIFSPAAQKLPPSAHLLTILERISLLTPHDVNVTAVTNAPPAEPVIIDIQYLNFLIFIFIVH
jgi:hypothetical protein